MRTLTFIFLILATIIVKAQDDNDFELTIENCIRDKYQSVGLDIEREFDIFQDTLISQGILLNKDYKSVYALYDTILSGGYSRYNFPYHIDKLEENLRLFYECFFQFKTDTTSAFNETKMHEFYASIDKIDSIPNVNIDTIIRRIKKVIREEDLKRDTYKYYTLYSFYFLITPNRISPKILLPKSDVDTSDKKIIHISIDKDQQFYINQTKTKEKNIGQRIDKIVGDDSDDYIIVLKSDKAAIIANVVKIMDIAKKKNIKLIVGTD
jgi:biopolymer transport protein ExbD